MMSATPDGVEPGSTIISPDFRIPLALIGIGVGLAVPGENIFAGIPITLIGAALTFQTTRLRFVFDSKALELKYATKDGLVNSGENFKVGGANRWDYDTFTNWVFYPSPSFPILVYFKETQTSPEGQIHFFPVIADGKKLYETMVEKSIPRL
eukprot:CAMPEP_0113940324 /NCGR_PEP_ID=MMETSP1339-20121228/6485_1 /TAXON_ID=94617 /ORGANISM="Fibrocapsa japonica" /LENGTH=151 /DNA_ID=CAMNT_0000944121 /DNA_START=166 /DNA_END=621 /DNA_ORIENTATION=- /assembly_acc=CAM_ASM_000762